MEFKRLVIHVVFCVLLCGKMLQICLVKLDVCPVNVFDMRSLEFTVKLILVKLFRT